MDENGFFSQVFVQPTRENSNLDIVLVTIFDLIYNREIGEKLCGCGQTFKYLDGAQAHWPHIGNAKLQKST